jgi:uncharacterized protein (TIGR00266 family)
MRASIAGGNDFGHLRLQLETGEVVLCEAGALAARSGSIEAGTRLLGGLGSSLLRSAFGGQSLAVGEYRARDPGEIVLAPRLPGQVVRLPIDTGCIRTQAGSFLACTPGVELETEFLGAKALFSGERMFVLRCSGSGDLWIASYGSIVEEAVDGGLVVNTGNLVAWEDGLEWEVTGMGTLKSTLFSGEGLVLRFQGQGRVWVQTRNLESLAGWVRGFLKG